MVRIFTPVKIQRLRPGLNPQTWVPEASMLTTRPPKPSGHYIRSVPKKFKCLYPSPKLRTGWTLMLCLTFMYFMLGLKDNRHSHLYDVFLKDSAVANFPLYEEPMRFLIFH